MEEIPKLRGKDIINGLYSFRDKAIEFIRRVIATEEFDIFSKFYRETTPILVVIVISELLAGVLLLDINKYFVLLPGLLVIVPGLMESRGSVVSNVATRLGTSVHLGLVSWDLGINDEVMVNIIATIILNMILSFVLAFFGWIMLNILGIPHISFLGLFFIAIFMALTIGMILLGITILVVLVAHRLGIDPDNVTIPIVATLGDVLTISFLYLTIRVTLAVNSVIPFVGV